MRHQVKRHRIARNHAHRKATLAALTTALIKHKRIETTLSKAKALRVFAEPIINRAKEDTQHNRRQVFRHLQDKHAVTELFDEVGGKIADRPGGYTRVIKIGARPGDAAEMAVIELVDYNDVRPSDAAGGRRRRTRRGGGGGGGGRSRRGGGTTPAATTPTATIPEQQPVVSETSETTSQNTAADATGVDETSTEEVPVAPEQEVPVPERTEPNAEAEAAAEEQASEESPAGEPEAEAGEDEEKKTD